MPLSQLQKLLQFQLHHSSQSGDLVSIARKLCISYKFHKQKSVIACEGYHNIVQFITNSDGRVCAFYHKHLRQISQLVAPLVTTFTNACAFCHNRLCIRETYHKQSRVSFSLLVLISLISLSVFTAPQSHRKQKPRWNSENRTPLYKNSTPLLTNPLFAPPHVPFDHPRLCSSSTL